MYEYLFQSQNFFYPRCNTKLIVFLVFGCIQNWPEQWEETFVKQIYMKNNYKIYILVINDLSGNIVLREYFPCKLNLRGLS